MLTRRNLAALLIAGSASLLSGNAAAEAWPVRPVKVIVPFPAGGVPDLLARVLGEKLAARFGQPFVVENRSGAGGNIGTEFAAKASPDGHVLLINASGPMVINPSLYPTLPFDPGKDFAPISLLATVPNVLVVSRKFPAGDVKGFIAHAKKHPGHVTYGSIGNGSSQHLAATQFETATGIRMTHVPYRAANQAVADLVGGQIDSMYQLVPNILAQIHSGHVRALAVTTRERSAVLPAVPTMAELGVKDYDSEGWFGMFAPHKTPPEVVKQLNEAVREVLADSTVRKNLLDKGLVPQTNSPEEFGTFIERETVRWRRTVQESGAKID